MSFKWGYGSNNGPQQWLSYFPDACGNHQSPIDINCNDQTPVNSTRQLTWKYVPENCLDVTNTGYCWKVHVHSEGSELTGGPLPEGDKYVLEQFHCHWGVNDNEGSEHTVCGRKFSGEIHFVHWNSSKYNSLEEAVNYPDGLCVLGVFFKLGKRHDELNKIVSQLTNIEYKGMTTSLPFPVNPELFLPQVHTYWTYQGSLTTPPCSECVIWIVFKDPIEVSPEQLSAFRNLKSYSPQEHCPNDEFKGFVLCNYRPTFPLGEREIQECSQ